MRDAAEAEGATYSLDKVLETELNRQSRLAHASVSEDDELVEHHSARHDGRLWSGPGLVEKRWEASLWWWSGAGRGSR